MVAQSIDGLPERRGDILIVKLFGQVDGDDHYRAAILIKKITGVETGLSAAKTIIYYPRPGTKSLVVDHSFDTIVDLIWPREVVDT
jgi:hypothetical protein